MCAGHCGSCQQTVWCRQPYLYGCFFLQNGKEYVKKVKGIFCFKVKTGDKEGVWIVDVKNGNGSVMFNPNGR